MANASDNSPYVLAFLDSSLPSARMLAGANGISILDSGPGEQITVSPNGTLAALSNLATNGLVYFKVDGTFTGYTIGSSATTSISNVDNAYSVTVTPNTTVQQVQASLNGNPVLSTRSRLNFIPGSGVNLNVADNSGLSCVDVTISASGGGGSANAQYIVQTPDGSLPNAQSLSALGTGLLKNTTSTGVLSLAVSGTDYMAPNANLTAIGSIDPVLGRILVGTGSTWSSLDVAANGTFLTVNGGAPAWGTLPTADTITVLGTTVTTQAIAANGSYVAMNASTIVVFTLPVSMAAGSTCSIYGYGAAGWQIAQNAGQSIEFGVVSTTPGTSGYLQSSVATDCVKVICVIADTTFLVVSAQGNITYN